MTKDERIKAILLTMTPREDKVLKMFFGLDKSCINTHIFFSIAAIAKHFAVTPERVSQILNKCERKLKFGHRKNFNLSFDFINQVIIDKEIEND